MPHHGSVTYSLALMEWIVPNTATVLEFDSSVGPFGRLSPRAREEDQFLLLRETQHRLANTLMILTSVLRGEFALSQSPEVQASLARCEARIVAFSNLHRSLVVGAGEDLISVQPYIERLCKGLSEALLQPLGIRCEVFADAGEFPSERCERLGLVIAELVTNAAKRAFHGRSDGLIRVELISKDGYWVCIVSDNGFGNGETAFGVGSKIIEQLVSPLRATVTRRSGSCGTSVFVRCQM